MAHDEASAGLLHELTDTHIADRARLGDVVAFDELVRRHSTTAVAYATVVTADAPMARDVAVRAFTDSLDQIESGGYSIDDPFMPGLLRSVRELGNAEAVVLAEANQEMDAHVPELARSVRWLTGIQGLDEIDTALALDVEDESVPDLVAWTDELLGERAAAVDEVLSSVHVTVPITFAAEARNTWRLWMATTGTVPVAKERRDRGALLPRIEPVATKILRGAAVVLLVAGAAGLIANNGGGSGHSDSPSREVAAAERSSSGASDSSSSSSDSSKTDSSTSSDPAGSSAAPAVPAAGAPAPAASSASSGSSTTGSGGGTGSAGGSGSSAGGGSAAPSSSGGSSPAAAPTGSSSGGTSTGGSSGGSTGGSTGGSSGGSTGGGGGGGSTPTPTTPPPATPTPTTPTPTTPTPTTPTPTLPTLPPPLGDILGGAVGGGLPGLP